MRFPLSLRSRSCSCRWPRRAVAQVQLVGLDGVVVDAASRPVGGAAVTVPDPLGATIRRATADGDGRFLDRRSPARPLLA